MPCHGYSIHPLREDFYGAGFCMNERLKLPEAA